MAVFMDGHEVAGPSLERGVVFRVFFILWLTALQNVTFAVRSRWPGWSKKNAQAQLQVPGNGGPR